MDRFQIDAPRALYKSMGFAQGIFLGAWWLAAAVWWVVELELSPFRLILLGTVLELAVMLSESPTGAVADVFSRKWSIVISWIVIGIGLAFSPISEFFPVLLVWQALWGLGYTFQSGADTAWVTDEIGEEDDSLVMAKAIAMALGILVGILVGIALARWSLPGTMVTAGIASIVFGLVLAVVMPERNFSPAAETPKFSERVSLEAVTATWRSGFTLIRTTRVLRVLVVATFILSMVDETVDRLDFARMRQLGFPDLDGADSALLFGLVWAGMTVLSLPFMIAMHRRSSESSDRKSAVLMTGLLLAAGIGVGLMAGNIFLLAIFGWVQRDVVRELLEPIGEGWMNRHADSSNRATVISFRSQSMAFGEIVGGLAIGVVAEFVSLQMAFVVGAGLLVLAAAQTGSLLRGRVSQPDLAAQDS